MRMSVVALLACAAALSAGSAAAVPIAKFYAYPLDGDAFVPSVAGSTVVDYVAGVNQLSGQSGDSVGFLASPGLKSRHLPADPGMAWSEVYAVNDLGQVLGLVVPANGDAGGGFYVTSANGRRPTRQVPFTGQPVAMNDAAQILGYRVDQVTLLGDTFPVSRCLFSDGAVPSSVRDIGAFGGLNAICEPHGMNGSGQITGDSGLTPGGSPDHVTQAFLTGANGAGMVNLGSFAPGQNSAGAAVNERGVVVGWSTADDYISTHAFITGPNGVAMRDLGTLGGDNSSAVAVNSDGNVVGFAEDARGNNRVFVTGDDGVGMLDLLSITVRLPRSTYLTNVISISDQGRIVVADRDHHAYVLCPTVKCQ